MSSKHFSSKLIWVNELLQIIHVEICRTFRVQTHGTTFYFIFFLNNFSKYDYFYLIKYNNEIFKNFRWYKSKAERQLGKYNKVLKFYRSGEYSLNATKNLWINKKNNVKNNRTKHITERCNKTIYSIIRFKLAITWLQNLLERNCSNNYIYYIK